MTKTRFIDKGLIKYQKAWDYQKELHENLLNQKKNENKETEQYLLFCEHPHVYTLGKSGQQQNLLIPDEFLKKIDAEYIKTDRGGDITYHGPGQIVGYPIFDLESLNIGVRVYIEKMEAAIIQTLEYFNLHAGRLDGATGVWLKKEKGRKSVKICAIGVKISRMISMHGFALNVNTDLNYFNHINPCGFQDKGVTSMENELGQKMNMDEVKSVLFENITKVFQLILTSN